MIVIVLVALAPRAGASVSIDTLALRQYYHGDVVVVRGHAGANDSLQIVVYAGQEQLYTNYSRADANGTWAAGFLVESTWNYGRERMVLVTDINTTAWAETRFDIVRDPAEIAADERAAADALLAAVLTVCAFVTLLAVFLCLAILGWASFRTRRETLREVLGRGGAWLQAWFGRWHNLWSSIHSDGNLLDPTAVGETMDVMNISEREIRVATEDEKRGRDIVEDAVARRTTAQENFEKAKEQYEAYIAKRQGRRFSGVKT